VPKREDKSGDEDLEMRVGYGKQRGM